MFRLLFSAIIVFCAMASALPAFAQSASYSTAKRASAMTDKGWPRTITGGATSFSIYQPQIEQWKDNRIEARAAVAVSAGPGKQPAYGVIWFAARTEIDGEPALRHVKDTNLTRIINTRVLLLRDESRGKYYLHLMDGWMDADTTVGATITIRRRGTAVITLPMPATFMAASRRRTSTANGEIRRSLPLQQVQRPGAAHE